MDAIPGNHQNHTKKPGALDVETLLHSLIVEICS